MATTSKRSMSQTLRPLSEMWDANGRIRPPQEETQDTATPEEEVRAEGVRMTAVKQKEVVADDKLNSDIETFIKNPEQFEGAEVRRADFGVREFSLGGRHAFTYNASAELAERKALAKLDDRKTFAELLTVDMPGKLEVAKELWTRAGDRDGASAEIGAIDGFVKDNYDTLVTLTKYNGHDDLATKIAVKARDMISGAYKTEFLTMDRDPEIRAKVAQKRALDMGISGDAAAAFESAAKGDPWSRTLLDAAGAPPEAAPVGAGRGQTPQAAKASAAGVDTNYVNGFVGFANKSVPALRSGLGAEYDLMTPADAAGVMKAAYDAGPGLGGTVLNVAVKASSKLTGQDRVEAFKSAAAASRSALDAWGFREDSTMRKVGASVLSALVDRVPSSNVAGSRQNLEDTMRATSELVSKYATTGVPIGDKAVIALSQAMYMRRFSPATPVPAELRGAASVLTEQAALKGRIASRLPVSFQAFDTATQPKGDQAAQPQATSRANYLATVAASAVDMAAATALNKGTAVSDELGVLAPMFARVLQESGMDSPQHAELASTMVLEAMKAGEEVNFNDLPGFLRRSGLIRQLEQDGRNMLGSEVAVVPERGAAPASVGESARRGVENKLYTWSLSRVKPDGVPTVDASGQPLSAEARDALTKRFTSEDPAVKLYDAVMGASVTRGVLPTTGDELILWKRMNEAIVPTAEKVLGPSSELSKYLMEARKVSELDSAETIDAGVKLVIDNLTREQPMLIGGVGADVANRIVRSHVQQLASGLRAASSDRNSALTLLQDQGDAASEAYSRAAAYRVSDMKAGDPKGLGQLASALTREFIRSPGKGGGAPAFFSRAKEKMLKLVDTLPVPKDIAAQQSAAQAAPDVDIPVSTLVVNDPVAVAETMSALDMVSEKLNRKYSDLVTSKFYERDLPSLIEKSGMAAAQGAALAEAVRIQLDSGVALKDVTRAVVRTVDNEVRARGKSDFQARLDYQRELQKIKAESGTIGGDDGQ